MSLPEGAADPMPAWRALRQSAALTSFDHRAILRLEGAETADLLHRITSADTLGMAAGQTATTCIMNGKGKLLALFELGRAQADRFLAEVDRPAVDALQALIDRFIFGERIELLQPEWRAIAVVGPQAPAVVTPAPEPGSIRAHGSGYLLRQDELGVPMLRLHAPAAEVEAFVAALAAPLPLAGYRDLELLRIDAGFPRYGVDADAATIPIEVNLDRICSQTKGCYAGQEVIARIHTYGHVNRTLARLAIETDVPPDHGSLLFEEELEVGRITSAARSPADGTVHALAMLPAALAVANVELRLTAPDGPVARVL